MAPTKIYVVKVWAQPEEPLKAGGAFGRWGLEEGSLSLGFLASSVLPQNNGTKQSWMLLPKQPWLVLPSP